MQKLGTRKKKRTEEDFKESGVQRVVVATCALGMGINFQNVEYVIHYGPPHSVTDFLPLINVSSHKM